MPFMVDIAGTKHMLYLAWSIPLLRMVDAAGASEVVSYDVRRWHGCLGLPEDGNDAARFANLVGNFPEFRSLVHYRIRALPALLRWAARILWPREKTLQIYCDFIGPGLFIQHGYTTYITADAIGRDCWINQQVTIGYTSKGRPVIGDRVRIHTDAVIIGPIEVGDDATIGANATVVKNVPPGATMVAPQAQQLPTADAVDTHPSTVNSETFSETTG